MKLNPIDRLVFALSPQAGLARIKARAAADVLTTEAGYDGAGKGRRHTWSRGSASSANVEVGRALTVLRHRHRELARNNPYVSSAIESTAALAVGDGLKPVAMGGNKRKRKLAQELMNEWAGSLFCDADEQHNLAGLQALAMRTETESGEVIALRSLSDRSARRSGVRIPLEIRILEGDYLDHLRDGQVDGRRVVQGVAFTPGKKRAGYYIHKGHPGDGGSGFASSNFADARDVAHMYCVKRPGQVRGIPRATASMMYCVNLDGFNDARLEQQKIAACLAAFITQGEEGKAAGDPLPAKLEPGLLARLKQDETVSFATPPSTSGQDLFVSGYEHMIAKSYGLNHQIITGNIGGANFASTKIGRLDVYANIAGWRSTMLVPHFLKRIEQWFIESATLLGFDIAGVYFDWTPPRSQILNLRDDIPALIKQSRAGFGSLFEILRGLGYSDPRKVLEEIAEVNGVIDELDLVLDSDARTTTAGGQLQSAGAINPETAGDEPQPDEVDDEQDKDD